MITYSFCGQKCKQIGALKGLSLNSTGITYKCNIQYLQMYKENPLDKNYIVFAYRFYRFVPIVIQQ